SLGRSVTIILGGKSKGLDFSSLLPSLKKYARQVVITGENAQEIYSAIGKETDTFIIPSFEEAIKEGKRLAKETGALLLSPASTSYDSFRNYAERGERFKAIITKKD
ncbi:MAG: UDP-N-acetylmuramoyl-L-alanine--D-glutamate ligase, partial [Clostridia bacterium]|nr:UDP-N-acetylmuramoyl-L-alanine--D-glutamate ligase [Clostridia bacterium]